MENKNDEFEMESVDLMGTQIDEIAKQEIQSDTNKKKNADDDYADDFVDDDYADNDDDDYDDYDDADDNDDDDDKKSSDYTDDDIAKRKKQDKKFLLIAGITISVLLILLYFIAFSGGNEESSSIKQQSLTELTQAPMQQVKPQAPVKQQSLTELPQAPMQQQAVQEQPITVKKDFSICTAKTREKTLNTYTIINGKLYIALDIMQKETIYINENIVKYIYNGNKEAKFLKIDNSPNEYVAKRQLFKEYDCRMANK